MSLVEAEEEVGAGAPRRAELLDGEGIDADREALRLEQPDASSRCGKGVSGRPPRSITSAPASREARRRSRMASTEQAGRVDDLGEDPRCRAATGRALRRRARNRRAGRRSRPARARTARRNGRRAPSRSARQRPGRIDPVVPSTGRGSRRRMISSVISAATLTPCRSAPAKARQLAWSSRPATWPLAVSSATCSREMRPVSERSRCASAQRGAPRAPAPVPAGSRPPPSPRSLSAVRRSPGRSGAGRP